MSTGKSKGQLANEAVRQEIKRTQEVTKSLATAVGDGISFDGFKKGAAYSQTLFESLKQTPGAIHDMATMGITLKDVQGYLDGDSSSTFKMMDKLKGAGKEGDAFGKVLSIMKNALREGTTASDEQAKALGVTTQHMRDTKAESDKLAAKLRALGLLRPKPNVQLEKAAAERDANNLASKLRALGLLRPTPVVRVDATAVYGEIARVQNALGQLTAQTFNKLLNFTGPAGPAVPPGAGRPTSMRQFAFGGIEDHSAQIASGAQMRMWAEPETGGEA